MRAPSSPSYVTVGHTLTLLRKTTRSTWTGALLPNTWPHTPSVGTRRLSASRWSLSYSPASGRTHRITGTHQRGGPEHLPLPGRKVEGGPSGPGSSLKPPAPTLTACRTRICKLSPREAKNIPVLWPLSSRCENWPSPLNLIFVSLQSKGKINTYVLFRFHWDVLGKIHKETFCQVMVCRRHNGLNNSPAPTLQFLTIHHTDLQNKNLGVKTPSHGREHKGTPKPSQPTFHLPEEER